MNVKVKPVPVLCVTFQSQKNQGKIINRKVDGGSCLALGLCSSSASHWYANRSEGCSEFDGEMTVRLTCRKGGLGMFQCTGGPAGVYMICHRLPATRQNHPPFANLSATGLAFKPRVPPFFPFGQSDHFHHQSSTRQNRLRTSVWQSYHHITTRVTPT